MSVLAIDAGTTGVTAVVVTADGRIAARGYQEFAQHFPKPGWVEHAPEEIWQATVEATRAVLKKYDASELQAVGITNQRETILLWDRETLGSPRRGIVWQDRRTADICTRLRDEGHEDRVTELTGLRLDPYFSGTKLMWLAENEPNTWALVESGRYAIGTVDSYLVARMTRGTWHVTDVSNACRTLLLDLDAGDWSDELCSLFGVPRDALPELVPNWGEIATTDAASFCGLELPIAGMAGDQQSALFGQTCFDVGDSKCTYGTGSFILTNTGTTLERSDAGLLSTAAWRSPDGELTYALEGAIFVTGAAVQWLRDGLQIIGSAAETAAIAATVDDTEGVVFVPALTGLGAPHWDPHARGLLIGLTRGTTRAHIVRATLEAIAFEVRDVLETMPGSAGSALRADGGASANDLLCQIQADQIGSPVERPEIVETTALGAAFLAGLGTGVWSSTDDLRHTWQLDRRFEPSGSREAADAAHARWTEAVTRSKGWADSESGPGQQPRRHGPWSPRPRSTRPRPARPRRRRAPRRPPRSSPRARRPCPAARRARPGAACCGPRGRRPPCRRRPVPRTPRPVGPLPPPAPARPGCAPSGPPPGRVRRAGRAASPARPRGLAANPSASGVATAPATSASPIPVLARAVTSRPLRTARAHSSSTMAAVSVASTWSATACVTFTPSSEATDRARVVTAAVS